MAAALLAFVVGGVVLLSAATLVAPLLEDAQGRLLSTAAEREARVLERDLQELLRDSRRLAENDAVLRCRGRVEDCPAGEAWGDFVTAARGLAAIRSHYLQLRVIDARAPGMELVRIDRARAGDPVRVVPDEALQPKGDRPYVLAALADLHHPQVSPIELNREYGRIQEPHQVVVRVSRALLDERGRPWGVLVINADPFAHFRVQMDPGLELLVACPRGDFVVHPDAAWRHAGDLGHRNRRDVFFAAPVDPASGLFHREWRGEPWTFAEAVATLALESRPRQVQVFVGQPESRTMVTIRELQARSLGVALGLALLVASLVFVFMRSVLDPLQAMGSAARHLAKTREMMVLPAGRFAEIDDLRASLMEMSLHLSERRDALEAELVERDARERQLRSLIESMPAGVLFVSREGNIRFTNPAAITLFGIGRLEGNRVESLLPEGVRAGHARLREEYFRMPVAKGMRGGRVFELPRGPDGESFFAELNLVPFDFADEAGVVVVVHDVSAVRAEREQAAQIERERSLRQVSISLAHETNNALASLQLGLERLTGEGSGRRLDREQLETLADVHAASARIADTIGAMLAYSGTAHRSPERFALVPLLRSEARDRFRLEVDPRAAELAIAADPAELRRVLHHLVSNAWEADPGRLPVVRVDADQALDESLTQRWGERDAEVSYLRVAVVDRGSGMSAEIAAQACDPLFGTKPDRSGVGLTLALGAVRSAGGCLGIRSAPGRGTSVIVWWPIAELDSRVDDTSVARTRSSFRPEAPTRVLLVDDDPLVLRGTKRALARAGLEITAAESGEEALALTSDRRFDVVVSDMRMPRMGGDELLRALRERNMGTPVVLVSGQTDAETADLVASDPTVRFLAKPFRAAALLALISELQGLSSTGRSEKPSQPTLH